MQLSLSNKKVKMLLYAINYCLCVMSAQSLYASFAEASQAFNGFGEIPVGGDKKKASPSLWSYVPFLGQAQSISNSTEEVAAALLFEMQDQKGTMAEIKKTVQALNTAVAALQTVFVGDAKDAKENKSIAGEFQKSLIGIQSATNTLQQNGEKIAQAFESVAEQIALFNTAIAGGGQGQEGALRDLKQTMQQVQTFLIAIAGDGKSQKGEITKLNETLLGDGKRNKGLVGDLRKTFRSLGNLAAVDEEGDLILLDDFVYKLRKLMDKAENQIERRVDHLFDRLYDAKKINKLLQKIGDQAPGYFFNYNSAARIAGYTSLTLGALVGTWYGVKLGFKRLERNMTKPTILLPDSHVGLRDSFKRWRSGYTTPAMIMSPQLRKRFKEIKQKTKMTVQRIMEGEDLTFDNLLLIGPPGTGKTLFGRALADSAGMYYAATTAGALLQSDQGIEHLNGLIALAEHSDRPIMLFFDEFDSFVVDRNKLDPSSQHYKVVNQFLALTGQKNKFMVVAATNYAKHLDSAIARRFHDRIDMELPTLDERKQLVELCIKQIIFNTKHNSAVFIKHAREFIQQDDIAQRIANRTEGLSHAELDNLVSAMYKKALLSRNKRLTLEHAREATKEAVDKYERFKSDHQVQVKKLQGG